MGYSNFAKDKIVDKVLNGTDFTPPATYYIAFCTTDGGDNALGNEPAIGTNGYQRIAVTRGTAAFPLAGGDGIIQNAQEIVSAVSSGAWAAGAAVVAIYFMDAASGGDIWMRATVPLNQQHRVGGANQQLVFPVGSLTFTQAN